MKALVLAIVALAVALSTSPAVAQVTSPGGSIGPNTSGQTLNYQLAIPDGSGGYNPGVEIATGRVEPGKSVDVPNDPSLCGLELRVFFWTDDVPPVGGVVYYRIECP